MKIDEVPQDELPFKDRDQLRKLLYATDASGEYKGVPSAGWDAEHTAMVEAWEAVGQAREETIRQVREGRLSPLAYYMDLQLMDLSLLARYAGKWVWQVKRHLRPDVFAGLSDSMKRRYADLFKISVEELVNPKLI